MKYLAFLLILAFALAVPAQEVETLPQRPTPQPSPETFSTVRGRVFYAETGRPVRRAPIMLISPSGPGREMSAVTDNFGNFEIRGVRAGTYYPMINAPGVISPLAFIDLAKIDSGKEAMIESFSEFEKIVVNGVNETYVQIAARRGGAISGRVTYDDGDPAIGVRVEVLRKVGDKYQGVISNLSSMISGLFGGGGGFQTDDRGYYRFSGLPAGEYIVKVTENISHTGKPTGAEAELMLIGASGSFVTIYNPDVLEPESAQLMKVELGQEMTEVNLTIPARSLFGLGGRVVAAKDKKPVAAEIRLERESDKPAVSFFGELGRRAQSVSTDADGNWSFRELPKGKYRVIVTPRTFPSEDYEPGPPPRAQVPNKPQPPRLAKKVVEVTIDDKDQTGVAIELVVGAVISGTVSVENAVGEMPRMVSIRAVNEIDALSSAGSIWNDRFDPDGDGPALPRKMENGFNIENVSAGKTSFLVTVGNGEDFYVKSMTAGPTDLLSGKYDLKEGERLENVKIVLGKGRGTLQGRVINDDKEPAPNVGLTIVPTEAKRRNPTFIASVRSDADGEFTTQLAPGEYAIVSVPADKMKLAEDEWNKWLDEAVRSATKVTIEKGGTAKVEIKKQ